MQKTIKIGSIVIFIISLLAIPLFGIAILFGLAGSNPSHFIIIALGYIGLITSSFVCIFRYKFFPAIIISILIIISGSAWDIIFWKNENSKLCEELRADPTCIENQEGFVCQVGGGVHSGSWVPSNICDKELTSSELRIIKQEKLEALKNTNSDLSLSDFVDGTNVSKSYKLYSMIVDKIINSPSPENENFEDQLVAIYNCFEQEYGPGIMGEQIAIDTLKNKNLTDEQLSKYYAYLASKGRHVNGKFLVAGLPGGDKNLSCEYINAE